MTSIASSMKERHWEAFIRLATERHHVAPVVLPKLQTIDVPPSVLKLTTSVVNANAMRVLKQLAALRSIRETFEAADLPFAVLKGWPLSEQLFASNSGRMARDIDILIEPSLLSAAARQLLVLWIFPPCIGV